MLTKDKDGYLATGMYCDSVCVSVLACVLTVTEESKLQQLLEHISQLRIYVANQFPCVIS